MRPNANQYRKPAAAACSYAVRRLRRVCLGLKNLVSLTLVLSNLAVSNAEAQTTAPAISSPSADQALQGQVTITGTTGVSGFASAELDFAYAADPTSTWFLIQTLSQPADDAALATWDTTAITDGQYVMRLRVFSTAGTFQDALVPFEIANYSAPARASATPEPTEARSLQIPTPLVVQTSATAMPVIDPTPSPLPPNPAGVPPGIVYRGLGRGALLALAAFLVLGALLLRRRS